MHLGKEKKGEVIWCYPVSKLLLFYNDRAENEKERLDALTQASVFTYCFF